MKLRIDLAGGFICTDSVGLGGPTGQFLGPLGSLPLTLSKSSRFVKMHPSSIPPKRREAVVLCYGDLNADHGY